MNPPIIRVPRYGDWGKIGDNPAPSTHRFAGTVHNTDAELWAWPVLATAIRFGLWYKRHRWDAERAGYIRYREGARWFVFVAEPGGYYRDGRWAIRL